VAGLLAPVPAAVERVAARLLAAEGSACCHLAGHELGLLGTVALDWHIDVAGWTGARMAEHGTGVMLAVLVLQPVAVLAAGVRQNEWVVARLLEAPAVALVPGQLVLGIGEVAVRASPAVECEQPPGGLLRIGGHVVIVPVAIHRLVVALVSRCLPVPPSVFLLFLFVVLDRLLQGLVQFEDPALDAAEMERLATLPAVPQGTSLVDLVAADDALLLSLS